MKKTVHIINAMQIGGVEVGVLSLLKSAINSDYRVIAIKGCNNDLYQSLTSDEQSRLFVCNGYWSVILLLMKLKPKVIISSLWRAHLVSLMFKIIKPTTQRIHFVHNAGFSHVIDSLITRLSVSMANFIFCDSKQSQNWLTKRFEGKCSAAIPMNISFSDEKKETCFDPTNFVFVGRFCEQKNLLKALEFVKVLNTNGLISTFDLYGRDDGELQLLRDYVNNHNLSHLITFHESLLPTDIECEMRKYNYYLQTSLVEGMAISVYQAIKNGLLPVVTPVGEIKNYTENGVNAFYLDAEDIGRSAKKFKEIIAKGKVKKFSVGSIINKETYPNFDSSFFSEVKKYNSL